MIYTIIPVELIFQELWGTKSKAFSEVKYRGRLVEVESVSPMQSKIVRLISTDPMDYLDPEFAPGKVIVISPAAVARQ